MISAVLHASLIFFYLWLLVAGSGVAAWPLRYEQLPSHLKLPPYSFFRTFLFAPLKGALYLNPRCYIHLRGCFLLNDPPDLEIGWLKNFPPAHTLGMVSEQYKILSERCLTENLSSGSQNFL